jgi:hypothetical protein
VFKESWVYGNKLLFFYELKPFLHYPEYGNSLIYLILLENNRKEDLFLPGNKCFRAGLLHLGSSILVVDSLNKNADFK